MGTAVQAGRFRKRDAKEPQLNMQYNPDALEPVTLEARLSRRESQRAGTDRLALPPAIFSGQALPEPFAAEGCSCTGGPAATAPLGHK